MAPSSLFRREIPLDDRLVVIIAARCARRDTAGHFLGDVVSMSIFPFEEYR